MSHCAIVTSPKIKKINTFYVCDTLASFARGNKDESWSFHAVSNLYMSDSRHTFEYMIWFYCNLKYEPFSCMCARILKGKGWGRSWAFSVSSLRQLDGSGHSWHITTLVTVSNGDRVQVRLCVFGFALVVSCWFVLDVGQCPSHSSLCSLCS